VRKLTRPVLRGGNGGNAISLTRPVDWDYREDTFHNQWQTYRTKKEPKLLLKAFHEYEQPGNYTIVIKVIDILGNDTTKAVMVDVK
jgi:adenine-specific DNA-methyltransferase